MKKKILILSAHPDDASLGCAGSIKRFTDEGYEAHMLTFTDGISARTKGDRRKDVPKECEILGIKHHKCFDFPDNRMDSIPLLDIVKSIEVYIETEKLIPDIVFAHQPYCLNVDHQQVFKAGITVFRGLEVYNKTKIMLYETPSSSEWNNLSEFKPNSYIKIHPGTLSIIESALNVYENELRELPHPRNFETKKAKMLLSGTECGTLYAERFMIFREVI